MTNKEMTTNGMSELDAIRWVMKCPGLNLYIGLQGRCSMSIEGKTFTGEHLIEVARKAIKAGF